MCHIFQQLLPEPVGNPEITITITDEEDNPIENATVSVVESTSTGTVTVTVLDTDGETPLEDALVDLYTVEEPSSLDDCVGTGVTGSDGTCTLKELDRTQQIPTPTETDAEVTYGTYYLFGEDSNGDNHYKGILVVDGDENVTITLTGGE